MANSQINLTALSSLDIAALQELVRTNIEKVTIVSTYSLSSEEKDGIVSHLGLTSVKDMLVENIVDQSILGGIVIQMRRYYLDYSLKGTLQAISESLHL
ncbi:MAG: F0F1 ATP synthase subunit delta [Patescibacteria group bacterium]|jgi:F0F1-type ATP synthase delta subunit